MKKNRISLIRGKNQEKVKALLNVVDVGNEAQCTQMLSTRVAAKLRDTYDDRNVVTEGVLHLYLIWRPAQILEHVRVPETDLRLPQLLKWMILRFYCIPSWGLLQYIKISCRPLAFTSNKVILKKQKEVWN